MPSKFLPQQQATHIDPSMINHQQQQQQQQQQLAIQLSDHNCNIPPPVQVICQSNHRRTPVKMMNPRRAAQVVGQVNERGYERVNGR